MVPPSMLYHTHFNVPTTNEFKAGLFSPPASSPPNHSKFRSWKISFTLHQSSSFRNCTISAAMDESTAQGTNPVRIVALVGEGSVSPIKSTPWSDVMLHTAERLRWIDEEVEMHVFTDNFNQENYDFIGMGLDHANILMIVAVVDQESVEWILANCQQVSNVICFDSSPALKNKLGGSLVQTEAKRNILSCLSLPPRRELKKSEEVVRTVSEAWDRHNTDDIRFCLLVIINAYIRPVSTLKNLRAKGFSTLNCMVKNCGPQILNCLLDQHCRKALQCLNKCSPVDQVCNYCCIASYESPKLEEFSLCVLQKHNCLDLDAKIPEKPHVMPMVRFRGEDLNHEISEDLLMGWLGKLGWSWRVVAGQNPAYDQFPCQYQLFYRGKARGSFWYEPIFQVRTHGGALVWRRRKYRVKRGKVPGTFYFSVLDNGVVSNEFWTIVEVTDDFTWGLFHYHGAARVVGQSYSGAVLVSPDGTYPDEIQRHILESALDRCRIKEWELYSVNNSYCQNPPFGLPEGSCLHHKIQVEALKDLFL